MLLLLFRHVCSIVGIESHDGVNYSKLSSTKILSNLNLCMFGRSEGPMDEVRVQFGNEIVKHCWLMVVAQE